MVSVIKNATIQLVHTIVSVLKVMHCNLMESHAKPKVSSSSQVILIIGMLNSARGKLGEITPARRNMFLLSE